MSRVELRLHKRQGDALLTKGTEILYGGAAGGGKSFLMRVGSIVWGLDIPGIQIYLFRRKFPDLKKNHMEGTGSYPELLQPYIDSGQCRINWTEMKITFINGSRINLCHLQYTKDIYNYQGAEIHVLMMDELTHFLEDEYTYLRGRVRLGSLPIPKKYKDLFPKILCGTNPGGVGHNWVKQTFVDFVEANKLRRAPAEEGGMIRTYIPAKVEDNPTLMENDPGYINRLNGLGNKALVKALKDGDWDIVAGGAVDDVWDRKTHVMQPFRIPRSWYIDRSLDWGSSRPASVGWWAESDGSTVRFANGREHTFPAGTVFRIREYYSWTGKANKGAKLDARELAREVKKIDTLFQKAGYVVHPGPADNAIYNDLGTKKKGKSISIASEMEVEGIKWTKSEKSAGTRRAGLIIIRQLLKEALKPAPEEKALYIFENCRHFIRTVPVLPRSEKDPDDVDTDAEDHVYDETRYRLLDKKALATVQKTDFY